MSEIVKLGKKGVGSMNNLTHMAIYIYVKAKETRSEEDPLDIGARVARSLRLRSTETEKLVMGIWIAEKFGIESNEIQQANETVTSMPEFETIHAILNNK